MPVLQNRFITFILLFVGCRSSVLCLFYVSTVYNSVIHEATELRQGNVLINYLSDIYLSSNKTPWRHLSWGPDAGWISFTTITSSLRSVQFGRQYGRFSYPGLWLLDLAISCNVSRLAPNPTLCVLGFARYSAPNPTVWVLGFARYSAPDPTLWVLGFARYSAPNPTLWVLSFARSSDVLYLLQEMLLLLQLQIYIFIFIELTYVVFNKGSTWFLRYIHTNNPDPLVNIWTI